LESAPSVADRFARFRERDATNPRRSITASTEAMG
jgi:hypothetical protein